MGEDVDTGPVHAFMALPELERDQYCIDVIKALAGAAETIMNMKPKLKQAKAVKELMTELRTKRDELLPVFFYVIKPQFRDTFVELMEKFAGVEGV
jgi:hypothetical protein